MVAKRLAPPRRIRDATPQKDEEPDGESDDENGLETRILVGGTSGKIAKLFSMGCFVSLLPAIVYCSQQHIGRIIYCPAAAAVAV